MSSADFVLRSSEGYHLEDPRLCRVKQMFVDKSGRELALVKVVPPIVGQPFGLGGTDLDEVVLSCRFVGERLSKPTSWPVAVHVARLVRAPGITLDPETDLELLGWAELYTATLNKM